jgi:hypothetical protein
MDFGDFLHKMLPGVVWDLCKWLWERRYTLAPTMMAGLVATYQWLRSQPLDFWLLILVCVGSFLWLLGSHRGGISSKPGEEILRDHTTDLRYLWAPQVALLVALFVYIIYIHSSLREVRRELDCYIARRLTPDQITIIGTYLLEHKPDDIVISLAFHDEGASYYEKDFGEAFRKGNWRVMSDPTQGEILPGLNIFYRSNEKTRMADDARRPNDPLNPGEVMERALERARLSESVKLRYNSDRNLVDQQYKVMLTIGSRLSSLNCKKIAEVKEN